MDIDIGALIVLVGVLSSVASGLTEYLKTAWAASNIETALKLSDNAHRLIIQTFALASCLFVSFVAQFDVIHAIFPVVPVSQTAAFALSGVLLFLPADGLKVLLEAIKAIRDAKQAES